MARKKHLINVHTSTGTTAPTGASLYLGEIAVQHTPNDPGLWIKMGSSENSTEYEKFIGKTEITNLIQASNILGSAYTYSGISYVNSATTIADAYSALTKEMIDDEIVVASALNDLDERITFLEVSGSSSDDLEELSGAVVSKEIVVAAALNGLNSRIVELSGATESHTATTIANGTSSQMHLPTVSASDNGKILMVKNGAWVLETPVSIYTGSGTPSQSLGNDGDIYLQTS